MSVVRPDLDHVWAGVDAGQHCVACGLTAAEYLTAGASRRNCPMSAGPTSPVTEPAVDDLDRKLLRAQAQLDFRNAQQDGRDPLLAVVDAACAPLRAEIERLRAQPAGFAMRVLALCAMWPDQLNGDLAWRVDGEYAPITFLVDCSDTFAWATADCEPLTPDNVHVFERALADLGTPERRSLYAATAVRGPGARDATHAVGLSEELAGGVRPVRRLRPGTRPEDGVLIMESSAAQPVPTDAQAGRDNTTPEDVYQRAARAYMDVIDPHISDNGCRWHIETRSNQPAFRAAVDAGREDLTRRIAELEEAVRQMTFERDLACDVADQARAERDEQKARADRLAQQVADLEGQLAITKGGNT